jgi:hypothetical protein
MYVRRNGMYSGSVTIINEIHKMLGNVYFVSKDKITQPLAYKKYSEFLHMLCLGDETKVM